MNTKPTNEKSWLDLVFKRLDDQGIKITDTPVIVQLADCAVAIDIGEETTIIVVGGKAIDMTDINTELFKKEDEKDGQKDA